uniref:C-type lectin domain-containing protein n=1 Tax=Callorhinchus milii TaxID=7868 RepID=A0A4W3GF31_CALMI
SSQSNHLPALSTTTKPAHRDYYWIDQRKNWTEARDYCRNHYMDLISVRSAEEQKIISKMFDGDKPLWIGLYNSNHTTAGWKWINEDEFSYAHWKDNELNAHLGSEVCVAMKSGVWFNDDCKRTYWFICYQDRTYHRVNQKKSWSEARDHCRNFYTDLTSFRNPEEQKRTSKLFSRGAPLWIGLYNNKSSTAGWKWINGDSFNNDDWKHAEPDNLGSTCVAVTNALWLNNDCNQTYQFTCYKGKIGKSQQKSWTEDGDYCRNQHSDFVSSRNPEKHRFTSQMLDLDTPLWIGLYYNNGSNAGWKWTNGDTFNYTHWQEEPNDSVSSVICVTMSNGLWLDNYCNQTYRFICYKGKTRTCDFEEWQTCLFPQLHQLPNRRKRLSYSAELSMSRAELYSVRP